MDKNYAVFKMGSKQYSVKEGDIIDVDLLDAEVGAQVEFADVLYFKGENAPLVGAPIIKGYQVKCEVIGPVLGPKIQFVKYQPNHTQVRKHGARQPYTRLKVVGISKSK